MSWLTNLFSGGLVSSIEKVALEAIDTDKESAEAKALFVKTLDPNGKMRRDLSRFASIMYGFYLVSTTVLIFMVAFLDSTDASTAAGMMTELFLPITSAWGAIVSASFGTNISNNWKEAKLGNKNG
jgi:hypothetical protein